MEKWESWFPGVLLAVVLIAAAKVLIGEYRDFLAEKREREERGEQLSFPA